MASPENVDRVTNSLVDRWDRGCDSLPLLQEADQTITQLHAAVKTAQELAARRLMEGERLQSYWLGDKLRGGSDVCHTCHAHCVVIGDKDEEIERLTRDMAALQSQWDDMQQGFVEVFGEPVRDAIELLGATERLRSAHEPCEQRGPFAGLQSLSFDVSENPTIALVMRFDNIEHAQAARDQLWQPAGASRDASPADLVGALQDVVHTDPGAVRSGKAVRDAPSGERWPKSIAGEAPWCKCPDGDCAGWDEAINHGCCCRVANGR